MNNRIRKKTGNFTIVSNTILRDSTISFKAKGLFCYMFSMSEDWNFTIKSIATQQKDGYDSISNSLKELKEFGYIEYEKKSDGTGIYTLIDDPKTENPKLDNPIKGKTPPIKKEQLDKNKNSKKSKHDIFIENLKSKVKIKSKVNSTKTFRDMFNKLSNEQINRFGLAYIKHQEEKKEFAQRITAFLEDFNFEESNTSKSGIGGYSF